MRSETEQVKKETRSGKISKADHACPGDNPRNKYAARGAVGRDWTNKMVLNGFKMGQIGGIRGLWRYQYAIVDCRLTVG